MISHQATKKTKEAMIKKTKTTIKSLPIELVIMIIEKLPIKEALNLCKVLQLPEQVAVQYCCIYDYAAIEDILNMKDDIEPSSYKALFKNKDFLIRADSDDKAMAAVRTFDLDFLKKCIEEFKPDLGELFSDAAYYGFADAVKLLLSDARVDPSAQDNFALILAAQEGHLEIVKLLLQDARVNPSDQDNQALRDAAQEGHLEIVKLLLQDPRVNPSDQDIKLFVMLLKKGI